ncbi:DNA topoisomerase 6 subunit B [Castilleja foliolosa]|uniref:DNA topoisomerase 6 subunit B n=1 Tax=Castilleja foliolosa TaxID=1961234 RepID=A0ABD3CAL3_9LAMI
MRFDNNNTDKKKIISGCLKCVQLKPKDPESLTSQTEYTFLDPSSIVCLSFETSKAGKKRLAKEACLQEARVMNATLGKKGKAPVASKPARSREASYYRVTFW